MLGRRAMLAIGGAGIATMAAGCRRGAAAPDLESDDDSLIWQAPPGVAPADAETVWLRRLVGEHHDWVQYLDEPAIVADPSLRPVFDRVRGQLQPSEQVVSLFAVGGAGCSARVACRDRLLVVAGDRAGTNMPLDEGWALTDDVDGGELYVPHEAEEPVMVRFERVTIIAHGFDAQRVYSVLDQYGGPPERVRLAAGLSALRQFSGGYVFRADPAAGKGRGVVRSTTSLGTGAGPITDNATIFEIPDLAAQAAQRVAAGGPASVGEPDGQVLDQRGTLLVTRSSQVAFAEALMRGGGAETGGPPRR